MANKHLKSSSRESLRQGRSALRGPGSRTAGPVQLRPQSVPGAARRGRPDSLLLRLNEHAFLKLLKMHVHLLKSAARPGRGFWGPCPFFQMKPSVWTHLFSLAEVNSVWGRDFSMGPFLGLPPAPRPASSPRAGALSRDLHGCPRDTVT